MNTMLVAQPFNLRDLSNEQLRIDGKETGIWNFRNEIDLQNEIIIGMSPTNYHCYLICKDTEYHPRFSFNQARVARPRRSAIRAGFFVRIRGLNHNEMEMFSHYLKNIQNIRTRSCHLGVLEALKEGANIEIAYPVKSNLTPLEFFNHLVYSGLKKDGRKLEIDFFSTKGSSLINIQNEIHYFQTKFRFAYIFSDMFHKLLKVFWPKLCRGESLES